MIRRILGLMQLLLVVIGRDRAARKLGESRRTWDSLRFVGLPRTWHQPDEHLAFLLDQPDDGSLRPGTLKLALLGDTQIQHVAGGADALGSLLEGWSEPSSRPMLQTFFGDRLLARTLHTHSALRSADGVIFMGDALNTSCHSELDRFYRAVDDALADDALPYAVDRRFVILPGNHDGLLYGNFASRRLPLLEGPGRLRKLLRFACNALHPEWVCRCHADADRVDRPGPVDRNAFLDRYADWLQQSLRSPAAGAAWRPTQLADVTVRVLDGQPDHFLRFAAHYRSNDRPHQSFLVQVLDLTPPDAGAHPVFALLLDTNNYARRPTRAGMRGSIGPIQQRIVHATLGQIAEKLSTGQQATVVFVGHHPIHALATKVQRRLTRLHNELASLPRIAPLPLYVSAHRHRGGWYSHVIGEHPILLRRPIRWTDLNVSSLVDWPLGVRDFQLLLPAGDTGPEAVVSSHFHPVEFGPLHGTTTSIASADGVRAIGLDDSRRQREAIQPYSVAERLRMSLRDPDAAGLMVDLQLSHAGSIALVDLVRHLPSAAGLLEESDAQRIRQTADALADWLERWPVQSLLDGVHGTPAEAATRHRELGRLLVASREAITEASRRSDLLWALLCRSTAAASLADRYAQWASHHHVPNTIGDLWYRTAGNLEESLAVLPVQRPASWARGHGPHPQERR